MNYSLITLEILAVLLGLTVLVADLWVAPATRKPNLSILLSGGIENNYESVSNGERILTCSNSTIGNPWDFIFANSANGLRMGRLFYNLHRVKVP